MTTTSIYGSCVARDTAADLGDGWRILQYTARQSMLSAANGASEVAGAVVLDSPFQRRMVEADIAGDALEVLRASAVNCSILLLDIMDERLGVYAIADGSFITKTWELEKSGILTAQTEHPQLIEFGTDEHFSLWQQAAVKVAEAIHELETPAIVLAPPLADHDLDDEPLDYLGRPISEWNILFARYYDALESLGLTVLHPSTELAVADKNHQWGLAPFHYAKPMYEWFITEIRRAVPSEADPQP